MKVLFLDPFALFYDPAAPTGVSEVVLDPVRRLMAECNAMVVATPPGPLDARSVRLWQFMAGYLQLPVIGVTDGVGPLGEQVERWMAQALAEDDPAMPAFEPQGYAVVAHRAEWLPAQQERWVLMKDGEENDLEAFIKRLCDVLNVECYIVPAAAGGEGDEADDKTGDWAKDLLTRPVGGGSVH